MISTPHHGRLLSRQTEATALNVSVETVVDKPNRPSPNPNLRRQNENFQGRLMLPVFQLEGGFACRRCAIKPAPHSTTTSGCMMGLSLRTFSPDNTIRAPTFRHRRGLSPCPGSWFAFQYPRRSIPASIPLSPASSVLSGHRRGRPSIPVLESLAHQVDDAFVGPKQSSGQPLCDPRACPRGSCLRLGTNHHPM